jgi:hypothetical protein
MEAHYEELRADSEARELARDEIAAWDATAGDGLAPTG